MDDARPQPRSSPIDGRPPYMGWVLSAAGIEAPYGRTELYLDLSSAGEESRIPHRPIRLR